MSETANIIKSIRMDLENSGSTTQGRVHENEFTILMDKILDLEKRLKSFEIKNYNYYDGPSTPVRFVIIRSKLSISILRFEKVLSRVHTLPSTPPVSSALNKEQKEIGLKFSYLDDLLKEAKDLGKKYEPQITLAKASDDYELFIERLKESLDMIKTFFINLKGEEE